jgi:hypothetical protein
MIERRTLSTRRENPMVEEIRRNHQPTPTAEEARWMSTPPLFALLRVAIFVVVSVAVGTSASLWIERSASVPHVAKAGRG